jgi:hypothetical protein
LIKQQCLHEGVWFTAFEFALGAGIIGATSGDARPAALVQLLRVQLVKQTQSPTPHPHLNVDAAEVNPAPRTK